MFTVEVAGVIDLPRSEVFDYVADFRNAPGWQAGLVAVHFEDGLFPEGRRVVEVHRFMGMLIVAVGELVDWQPLDEFTVRGGPRLLRVESRYRFAPEGTGTRVSIGVTMRPRGPMRLLEPTLRRRLRRRLAPAFAELVELIEKRHRRTESR
jgi:hypothetical protein